MPTLTDDEIRSALGELPGWALEGNAIVKEYKLPSFRAAITFVNRIADRAEAADHHPEISNVYDKVRVALSTHSAGGVTEKDLALARDVEASVPTA
jgi:4a-hydroxytetrahydrobiopterin dehydratase